eukprot:gene30496-39747_t
MSRFLLKCCPASFGTHHGVDCWINYEPCGLFCGSMSYFFILYGMYTTTFCVIIPMLGRSLHALIHILCFNVLSLLAIYSHWRAMTTDPGAVPRDALPLLDDEEEVNFDPTSSKIGPWVNNCVGIGNHKLFLLFVFFVLVISVYSIVLVSAYYVVCAGLGTACGVDYVNMLVPNITTNETQIDRLKKKKASEERQPETGNTANSNTIKSISSAIYSRYASAEHAAVDFNEVFGCSVRAAFHYSWLLPVPIKFPRDVYVRSKVLGYFVSNEIDLEGEYSPLIASSSNLKSDEGSGIEIAAKIRTSEGDRNVVIEVDQGDDETDESDDKEEDHKEESIREIETGRPNNMSLQPVNRTDLIESSLGKDSIMSNVRKRL